MNQEFQNPSIMNTKQFMASGQYLVQEIEKRAEKGAKYFFSRGAMRFFSSRISELCWTKNDDIFFITSERDGGMVKHTGSIRAYTVRKCMKNGNIMSMGDFQEYRTMSEARTAIRHIMEVLEN